MTANRRSKRVVRSRMAQTGEKYTQARRAVLAAGGTGGGAGGDPGLAITWPHDSLGWFTDQAYNAILLADDEARMLSHPRVDPEHLLLAAARYGNVERLLAAEGISAGAIHDVIVRIKGFGGRLELRPRRSPASEQVLRRAVPGRGPGRLRAEHRAPADRARRPGTPGPDPRRARGRQRPGARRCRPRALSRHTSSG